MLGWAIKKGFQGATGAKDASTGAEDTTLIEAPDTPAPVFAARALKNAIFGSSNASEATAEQKRAKSAKNKNDNSASNNMVSPTKQSPSKQPTSILLTPGTGTARRKRVSFNHDVKAGVGSPDASPLASARQRRRSALQQALENSRSARSKKNAEKGKEEVPSKPADDESEDEWEDDVYTHDATEDLNEPRSESGKYWKAEFNRYRDEAMADIERMVRFKALAKSYAKKKDAEALELSQKLKEEQLKVAEMEEKIAAMSTQVADRKRRGSDREDATLMKDLEKQTALAARYRDQVKELTALVQELQGESSSNRSDRPRINTSPRTEQTLLEVNRELRRARSELREMDKLRREVSKLKSDLSAAEERSTKLHDDHIHRGAADMIQVKKLEQKLQVAKEESQQKDREIRQLKKDYETLKRDAKSRTAEALQVLKGKNDKIAELEKTIKTLEAADSSSRATRDLRLGIESLGKPSRYDRTQPARHHKRSASVEDLTLDMTQRSLLRNQEESQVDMISKPAKSETFLPPDWSDSFKDIKNELRKDKKEQMEVNKREKDPIMNDFDITPPRSITKPKTSLMSFDTGRAVSKILSNKLNQLPSKDSFTPKDLLNQKLGEARTAARTDHGAEMQGALEVAAPRPTRPQSYPSRPLSSGSDGPGFDLMRDRFARLGGPEPERNSSSNTSRCTLPAERQAAARARLEQKKLERQRNGGGRNRDKENIRP